VTGSMGTMVADFQQELITVTDPNNTVRAQMGNLAANGASAAQWGFRANDASGAPIFDSLGLISISVMKVLGTFTNNAATAITSTTPVVEDGVTVTFSLARAVNVLALAWVTGRVAGTGTQAIVQLAFDGVLHGVNGLWVNANSFTQSTLSHFINLAAGSHTVDVRVNVDTGNTWTNFQTTLDVFQLGN
jgi:hypothetical protein